VLTAVSALAATAMLSAIVTAPGAQATTVPVRYPPISSVIITEPLPGFTAAVPGPTNGPLTASGFAAQSSNPTQATSEFDALARRPGFAAYLRLWTDLHGTGKGANDIVVTLFRVTDPAQRADLVSGLRLPYEQASGATLFRVPSIPGAGGYTVPITSPSVTEQVVVFSTGSYVAAVQLASSDAASNPAPFSSADAIGVAFSQYLAMVDSPGVPVRRPASPTTAGSARSGGLHLGGVLVVLAGIAVLAALAWLTDRRLRPRHSQPIDDPWGPTAALAAMGALAIPASRPPVDGDPSHLPHLLPGTEPGWQPDPSDPVDSVRYWDGERWTAHLARRTASDGAS